MRRNITATIITIGDELLIGQVIDTNSAFISREMNEAGILIERRISVADRERDIVRALENEAGKVNLVLITGGLGGTSDDLTKGALSKFFGSHLKMNDRALKNIQDRFRNIYHRTPSGESLNQAKIPESAIIIQNKRGLAPGMIFEKDKTYFVSMPGVPYEMEGIVIDLIKWLKPHFKLPRIIHQHIITVGIGEVDLSHLLLDFEKNLLKESRLAYLPGPGGLRLRLTSVVSGKEQEAKVDKQYKLLKKLTKDYIVMRNDTPAEVELGRLLKKHKQNIATAESCTGGRIASLITSVPGASAYYPGSVISYSNSIKESVLGVRKSTLKKVGAVSEEVVIEMVKGLLKKMKSDIGIAVSGIMGPEGGSAEKPVGTVWIAVGNSSLVKTQKIHLRFDRHRNIEGTAQRALYMAIQFLENDIKAG